MSSEDSIAETGAPVEPKPQKVVRRGYLPCLAATLCSVVIPGTGHLAIRAPFRRRVIAATVLNVVAFVALIAIVPPGSSRSDLVDIIESRIVFVGLGVVLLILASTRLWAAIDSGWQARPTQGKPVKIAALLTATVVIIGGVGPLVVGADYIIETDRAVEKVFGSEDAETARPTELTTTTTATGTDTGGSTTVPRATPTTEATTTTVAPFAETERVNVLLMGGDAGPGRYSLRTDTMVVISIDPVTGDTAMISIPRNLWGLPFPPGTILNDTYPKGFKGLANAVYPTVAAHPDDFGGGDPNEVASQAVKQGIAQFLGIPIHYYVLVDMLGFVRVVDALGGVDIYLPERIHTARSPTTQLHPVPKYFEAGQHHFDGTEALSYSRTRYSDSDYGRMGRQRCMLGAIAAAATPTALATGLTDLVSAFGDAVRTDIPRNRLGEMAQLVDRYVAAGGFEEVRTLHLAPPTIPASQWDPVEVRALVADVLAGNENKDSKSTSDQCGTP
ncbi:MAG: LCP family protein [Actinomycetia bacterium]|nr:LCP family protein [Actinomycetes bacterium]